MATLHPEINERIIRRLINQEKVPAFKIGRRYLIKAEEWEKYIDSTETIKKKEE
ncbi:MAG: helix-turn-helix domain-containing protein [Firmicutes bacterium]|nr:helix-turn-helix domain-containing protein [Bacillota bacterium]